jgi:outer membrane protein assembly factor BamA
VVDTARRRLRSIKLFQGSPVGLYPTVTTVYPGGWVAFGGGYRHPFASTAAVNVGAAWSVKNFKKVDASLALPSMLNRRLTLEIDTRWMDAPTVAYYGIGNESNEDKTTFGYRPTSVGVTATAEPRRAVRVGGGVGYVHIDRVSALEGAEDIVAGLGRPAGFDAAPRYLRSRAFAEFDSRPAPGFSTRGGMYRIELEDYSERSGAPLGFRSLEIEGVQLVPLGAAKSVIALRGLTTLTDDRDGDDVPFYLLPAVGGNSSVRGYPSFRFRGNHRLLVSAEYRWAMTHALDLAAFYDAGRVANAIADVKLADLKWAYGIGARVHSTRRTTFRVELARNDEGSWRFVWSTGASF